jgi:hypothetical protein
VHTPPFCPARGCPAHWQHSGTPGTRFWRKAGHYCSLRSGRLQRFQCRVCGHRFSEASFSLDYYAKRRISYHRLLGLIVNSASIRGAARQLHTSPAAVTLRLAKLARQALAVHAALRAQITVDEPLVADGLESFWVSQFYPTHFNVLVGAHSQFIYAVTTATLRRSGRMTPAQRARRSALERRDRPDSAELTTRFTELLSEAAALWHSIPQEQRRLITDRHTAYPRALASVAVAGVSHTRISSGRPRTVENPLFAVNYTDREIRKDLAEHRRETVCFARNAAASLQRMWVYLAYHNYRKPYRIGVGCRETHAERAGVSHNALRAALRHSLTRRAFLSRTVLSRPMLRAWVGAEHTPLRENWLNARITPRYALD